MTARFENGLSRMEHLMLSMSLAGMLLILFPVNASASTANKTRLVFEIKNLQNISTLNIPTYQQLAAYGTNGSAAEETVTEEVEKIDPAIVNAQVLRTYLAKKNSPLADYSETLLAQENWKLVLAISNGESTMCKRQRNYNCWGIGGAWNLRQYSSFEEGIVDVNRILTDKYVARGLDSPEKIVNRYVGHPNSNWVVAVNQILNQLNSLPLEV
jgi:hypothetical protein